MSIAYTSGDILWLRERDVALSGVVRSLESLQRLPYCSVLQQTLCCVEFCLGCFGVLAPNVGEMHYRMRGLHTGIELWPAHVTVD